MKDFSTLDSDRHLRDCVVVLKADANNPRRASDLLVRWLGNRTTDDARALLLETVRQDPSLVSIADTAEAQWKSGQPVS